ncbi:MAG: YiaA/YiaB family inner membrane protein [Janthinobacterium lividum]
MARHDTQTPAWITFSYISFCTAVSMAALGIIYLPLDLWMRGYLAMAALFLVHASISLTKTLRDRHEADRPAASEFGR